MSNPVAPSGHHAQQLRTCSQQWVWCSQSSRLIWLACSQSLVWRFLSRFGTASGEILRARIERS